MDMGTFARSHVPQITATAGLVTYALLRNKLTTGGIFAGILVATMHMIHPWPAFFWLLILFFLFGTVVTKVRRSRTYEFCGIYDDSVHCTWIPCLNATNYSNRSTWQQHD